MSPELSEQTRKTITEIVARYPEKEAALLPVLHAAQKEFGYISHATEKTVAGLLNISPARVHEVVTFYTMYNRQPVGRYHVQICSNLSCSLLGAGSLIDHLSGKLGIKPGETTSDQKYTLSLVQCLGACEQAPCMMVNFDYYGNLNATKIDEILDNLYQVKAANLRGRGGAGFPAGVKWGFVPKDVDKPKYLCVNADEGEPGTFKDRYIMTFAPHMLLEGIIITCFCVGINTAYIYIPKFTFIVGPVPTSVEKKPPCWSHWRANGATRASNLPFPPRSACSSVLPSSTT
jgi:NADH-quinone oxidoreductase E subunit